MVCVCLCSLSLSLSPMIDRHNTFTGTATLLDAKNDKNVIAESYLWKKSRGGLFSSDQMRRRRFRLCRDEKHGDEAAPHIKYYDANDSYKGTIVLDDILDVFCRAPTITERENGLIVADRKNGSGKMELKYLFLVE